MWRARWAVSCLPAAGARSEALLGNNGYAARERAGVARQLDAAIACSRLFTMTGALQSAGRRRHLSIPRIALVIRNLAGVSKLP